MSFDVEKSFVKFRENLPPLNAYGEKVSLVLATKTQTADTINKVIKLGATDIGENRGQEFRDKFNLVLPCNYHFFGRLQSNKLKYIVGKATLIQSVDSLKIAEDISLLSQKLGVTQDILLEVNLGEQQKGGITLENLPDLFNSVIKLPCISVKGLMTVLKSTDNENELCENCLQMRNIYDIIRKDYDNFTVLSMGMSHDYMTAIRCGSNMIRIGSAVFGKRP